MNITVSGKHVEVTPALEEQVRKGLEKLTKFSDGIIEVHAILTVEKLAHKAEVNIQADGYHIHGESTTEDMYKSIDVAISRIQTQILRHKEKIRDHRIRKGEAPPARLGVQIEVLSGEDLEHGKSQPRVINSRDYAIKPMSVDEAAMQMDLMGQDVLVFHNSDTNRLNVLSRRKDGNYNLIAPNLG
ncbi:MAG: ribosome-associated translation inhibitor RaiA [Candidatus Omnitrophica bacterium]|nr:MAG: putative sigma-54 modulation protein [Candidatus Hinthialibacteria bacterium OLB16]MBE7487866.1 ribosome-associated translation inhibitor RaiA [bacterium]MBK7496953.1 ribosome-associated translation inhibitor RaiA [Candidatus Omnitrophota bacterium]MBV6481763.1 Ribosome hibernation promotion factor [bacterium]MBW7937338.1 ribosome-associated translation inhibitor RaiA [Candidatus Omnitrophota bacterium]